MNFLDSIPLRVENTESGTSPVADSLATYFRRLPRLGVYSSLEINLTKEIRHTVVVEQDIEWLDARLGKFFKRTVENLTIEDIELFLKHLVRTFGFAEIVRELSLSVTKLDLEERQSRTLYFEQIARRSTHRSLSLSLLTQILIEKYTQIEARLIPLVHDDRTLFVNVIQNPIQKNQYFIFDAVGRVPNLHRREVRTDFASNFNLLLNVIHISHCESYWNEKKKQVSLVVANGRRLTFNVSGRTPTEKRFKREEVQRQQALPHETIPVEIYFHSFWRPFGHSSLRVGESLYEMSAKGWKVHDQGANCPRAFLFNNPFFRSQYLKFRRFGMAPISIGITIEIEKAKVDRLQIILQNLLAAKGWHKERFNILFNNCNQGLMRTLSDAGIDGFQTKGFMGFSSVLSFRKMLVRPVHEIKALNIYVLPNIQVSEALLRRWIPSILYKHNTVASEVVRTLPLYLHTYMYIGQMKITGFLRQVKNKLLARAPANEEPNL